MSDRQALTPWSRDALAAVHLSRFELNTRIPDRWSFRGWAGRGRGPFEFEMRHDDGRTHHVTAHQTRDIRPALDRLFVLVAEDSLEEQLAASLAERGIG